MKTAVILIAIGGAAGSVLRYISSLYFSRRFPDMIFPYGTFAVNVAGCFLIGASYAMSAKFQWFSPSMRLLFVTGFCGGFTTFSAFAYENMQLLQAGNYYSFAVYSILSYVVCIAAVFAGSLLIKLV
ncbi:MAG: crcB [Segetibacter sp.]|nr:crcB [Segetibacter sp.]